MKKELEQFRNAILQSAYDQALNEYGSWQKYRKEQWKSFLYYGSEDLLDLSLCLLSSARRFRYPIAALDLSAYSIKKFGLDAEIANFPVKDTVFNTRTRENDPVQYLSLQVKFGKTSTWRLHYGAHLLGRCALLDNNPGGYLGHLARNMTPPHDIIIAAEREIARITNHKCPYENRAEELRNPNDRALREATNFLNKEKAPSPALKKEIEAEVLIEKGIANMPKDDHL